MDKSSSSVVSALERAIASIDECRTYEDTLDAIVGATRTLVPEFGHVGLSLKRSDATLETEAGTDPLVWELDALQYDLGEGPCVEAMQQEPVVVVVRHLRHEQRWPHYIPAAIAKGVRSQLAIPLFTAGNHVGGLNLYSTDSDGVDGARLEAARLFAAHVAAVLGQAQEDQFRRALESRRLIWKAIGILMERYSMDADRAFEFLVRTSSTANTDLRDVAEELVRLSAERYRENS